MGLLKSMMGKKCARCGETRTWTHIENIPTCEACEIKLLAEREDKRTCPMCQAVMSKVVVQKVIVDRCPEGHGVWLDFNELNLIQLAMQEDADGQFANGMILGMMLD